jgi:hypothetical protein
MTLDPTRDEMLEYLAGIAETETDDYDCEEALYWFAHDYHGGQWSNLYVALCASPFKPGVTASGPQSYAAEHLYGELAWEYGA